MAEDFTRCSAPDCKINSYDVEVVAGATAGTLELTLMSGCVGVHDSCRVKAILMKVLADLIEDQGLDEEVLATCKNSYRCPGSGPGISYQPGLRKLTATTAATAPAVSPVVVPTPLSCDNLFTP